MLKLRIRNFLLWMSILSLIILSSCDMSLMTQERIFESDITEFYYSNRVLLNSAVQEYRTNTEGKTINIFYIENLVLDGVPGLVDETSEIVAWEPETKTNYTEHISKYKNCVATLKLMNDYMLKLGCEQINVDYDVAITTHDLRYYRTIDKGDEHLGIEFNFADIQCNFIYRLIYSETDLTDFPDELTPIDNNWYFQIW